MPKRNSFHDYVLDDLLAGIPGIASRAMFGGWGIYRDGAIFALIADGELYFKTGDENRPDFEKMKSRPFTYARKGKKAVAMSYWLVPPEILEDRTRLGDWVDRAVAATRSGGAPGGKGRYARLEDLPAIGPRMAEDLRRLGVRRPADLAGKDPRTLYDGLCRLDGKRHDPCVLYTFRCAIYAASNPRPERRLLSWWNWKSRSLPAESPVRGKT